MLQIPWDTQANVPGYSLFWFRWVLGGNGIGAFASLTCASTQGKWATDALLHSRKLCFHSDYDTTDVGLKLEYSNLNWEMIFLSGWIVYSAGIRALHICWYHFLFTSVVIMRIHPHKSSKASQTPKSSEVPENTGNNTFLQDVELLTRKGHEKALWKQPSARFPATPCEQSPLVTVGETRSKSNHVPPVTASN